MHGCRWKMVLCLFASPPARDHTPLLHALRSGVHDGPSRCGFSRRCVDELFQKTTAAITEFVIDFPPVPPRLATGCFRCGYVALIRMDFRMILAA
jgi:hypothetical protein